MDLKKLHLTPHAHVLTPQQRTTSLKQAGAVIWCTGLSGSGKSTLAMACESHFVNEGIFTFVLDGDRLRSGLNQDLGFSLSDREENNRRTAHTARLFADAGMITFVSLISPTRESRSVAREICHPHPFIEVYLSASLDTCEKRDPKGLYKKARTGEIPLFTGISSPYEVPLNPDLVIEETSSLEKSITALIHFLQKRKIYPIS